MSYSQVAVAATGNGKLFLGKSGHCRYCQKRRPEVSFSKEAHAIPQLLGNNEIFSRDECDSCNKFFGDGYDDDLSKYLGGMRTLSQIRGKKGIPSYKTKKKLSRIGVEEDGPKVVSTEGDDIAYVDEESNAVEIKLQRQPYSPLGVYNSFVKMAIALAPQEILPRLDSTRRCLIQNDIDRFLYFKPFMIQTLIPGPGPMKNEIFAMLLKRSKEENIPSLIFWLAVSNYCFQIVVPCPELDQNLAGKEVSVPKIPHPLMDINPYGSSTSRKVDLSKKEKVKGQVETISMHCSRIIPLSENESRNRTISPRSDAQENTDQQEPKEPSCINSPSYFYQGIDKTPGICGGDACIRQTRIPVWALVQLSQLGTDEAGLLRTYPTLTAEDLVNAWSYYRSHTAEIEQQIADNELA